MQLHPTCQAKASILRYSSTHNLPPSRYKIIGNSFQMIFVSTHALQMPGILQRAVPESGIPSNCNPFIRERQDKHERSQVELKTLSDKLTSPICAAVQWQISVKHAKRPLENSPNQCTNECLGGANPSKAGIPNCQVQHPHEMGWQSVIAKSKNHCAPNLPRHWHRRCTNAE